MASAPPIERHRAGSTARLPRGQRPARLFMLCAMLALIAVAIGIIVGAHRREPADAVNAAISNQSVIATPLPNMPTPTPLANKPTPTIAPTAPPPTAAPPTSAPPAVAAPLVQRPPANPPPSKPHDNGNGRGKGKEQEKDD